MAPTEFDSFVESPLGVFVESPLGVRETETTKRAVFLIAVDPVQIDPPWHVRYDEKLFRLALNDYSTASTEVRPPFWPSPHPNTGQSWLGLHVSGDSNVLWYEAIFLPDFLETGPSDPTKYTLQFYKMTSGFEVLNEWRWSAPAFGGGFMNFLWLFGTADSLWGLGRVYETRLGPIEDPILAEYLLELDPDTLSIIRSLNLYAGLSAAERDNTLFIGGGGTASVIWLGRRYNPNGPLTNPTFHYIQERSVSDFSLVRETDSPRSRNSPPRALERIGGDDNSIQIVLSSSAWNGNRLSELPADFSDTNRTILQDEIVSPWPGPFSIG